VRPEGVGLGAEQLLRHTEPRERCSWVARSSLRA
jgi:hypothetical protein